MTKVRQLRTGDLSVGNAREILYTGGVGSCVVVCLWDSVPQIGGMAHMLLPKDESEGRDPGRSPGLSPDTAIPALLTRMILRGAVQSKITARLVGAGNMFPAERAGFMGAIGETILAQAIRMCSEGGLPIVSQSVGGNLGRSVSFNVGTGEIEILNVNGEKIVL